MAVFDGSDLKKLRNERDLSAQELGMLIGCDESTVFRYEHNPKQPDPDMMSDLVTALGHPEVWNDWMRTVYRSYARRHPENSRLDLPTSVINLYSLVMEIEEMQRRIYVDVRDGHVDDTFVAEHLSMILEQLIQTAHRLKDLLPQGGDRHG